MLMIEFTTEYIKRSKADGGDPENCDGVLWAKQYCKNYPSATVLEWLEAVKLNESGWVLSSLHYNWNVLSEDERLQFIDALAETGSHKAIVNRSRFRMSLSSREFSRLSAALVAYGSVKAADRLRREHLSGIAEVRRG